MKNEKINRRGFVSNLVYGSILGFGGIVGCGTEQDEPKQIDSEKIELEAKVADLESKLRGQEKDAEETLITKPKNVEEALYQIANELQKEGLRVKKMNRETIDINVNGHLTRLVPKIELGGDPKKPTRFEAYSSYTLVKQEYTPVKDGNFDGNFTLESWFNKNEIIDFLKVNGWPEDKIINIHIAAPDYKGVYVGIESNIDDVESRVVFSSPKDPKHALISGNIPNKINFSLKNISASAKEKLEKSLEKGNVDFIIETGSATSAEALESSQVSGCVRDCYKEAMNSSIGPNDKDFTVLSAYGEINTAREFQRKIDITLDRTSGFKSDGKGTIDQGIEKLLESFQKERVEFEEMSNGAVRLSEECKTRILGSTILKSDELGTIESKQTYLKILEDKRKYDKEANSSLERKAELEAKYGAGPFSVSGKASIEDKKSEKTTESEESENKEKKESELKVVRKMAVDVRIGKKDNVTKTLEMYIIENQRKDYIRLDNLATSGLSSLKPAVGTASIPIGIDIEIEKEETYSLGFKGGIKDGKGTLYARETPDFSCKVELTESKPGHLICSQTYRVDLPIGYYSPTFKSSSGGCLRGMSKIENYHPEEVSCSNPRIEYLPGTSDNNFLIKISGHHEIFPCIGNVCFDDDHGQNIKQGHAAGHHKGGPDYDLRLDTTEPFALEIKCKHKAKELKK